MAFPVRHLLKISDLKKEEILAITNCALKIKKDPKPYSNRYEIGVVICFFAVYIKNRCVCCSKNLH
jgi:aspartate carbamoyltransferase catalytic subunit